jgi:anion-transporting  ArsA/GET3 family ATPase
VATELWPGVRLHVVTGKGGTGKTTVAGALALALAAGGRRILVIEVEGRQGIAQLFDVPPLPYEETRIAVGRDGGTVVAQAVDPEAAVLEYLKMFYNIKRGGTALKKIGAIDFATTIAPGLRDVLLTGKTGEQVRRRDKNNKYIWDAVVMDAPPTGRITRFLNVNEEVGSLARVGPVKNQADSVMRVMRSPETAVHVVTLLEEMPVQETIDGVADLRSTGLPVGSVFVNMLKSEELSDEALDAADPVPATEIREGLVAAGIPERQHGLVAALHKEAVDHATRVRLQRRERERLERTDLPLIDLPALTGMDLGGLYELAAAIDQQAPR